MGICQNMQNMAWRMAKGQDWQRWLSSKWNLNGINIRSVSRCRCLLSKKKDGLRLEMKQLFSNVRTLFAICISSLVMSVYMFGEGNGTPLQYSCLENPMDGGAWWAAIHGVAKSRTQLSDLTLTFHFHALEKEMATHSSVLAWRIPGMGEPGGLPSMGSHTVGHDWSNLAAAAAAAAAVYMFHSLLIGLFTVLLLSFKSFI